MSVSRRYRSKLLLEDDDEERGAKDQYPPTFEQSLKSPRSRPDLTLLCYEYVVALSREYRPSATRPAEVEVGDNAESRQDRSDWRQ
jgi:hypothetical protein